MGAVSHIFGSRIRIRSNVVGKKSFLNVMGQKSFLNVMISEEPEEIALRVEERDCFDDGWINVVINLATHSLQVVWSCIPSW